MMTVYILLENDGPFDGDWIAGVYPSIEEAKESLANPGLPRRTRWRVEAWNFGSLYGNGEVVASWSDK